jgi:outer membrane biosynthesis protein TonB
MAKLSIKKSKLVKLFEALGFKIASEWDDKRLVSKAAKLEEIVDVSAIKKEKTKTLVNKIIAAGGVKLKPTDEEPTEEKTPKKKKKKKTATEEKPAKKKKDKKSKKSKKEAKPKKAAKKSKKKASKSKAKAKESTKDALGCRLGTQAAKINACLTKKTQTIEKIAKAAKLTPARCLAHLRWLAREKELIKETNDGKFGL